MFAQEYSYASEFMTEICFLVVLGVFVVLGWGVGFFFV